MTKIHLDYNFKQEIQKLIIEGDEDIAVDKIKEYSNVNTREAREEVKRLKKYQNNTENGQE